MSHTPACLCAGAPTAICKYPVNCGRKNVPPDVEYADSTVGTDAQKSAIRSVGALIVPDVSGATCFLLAENWVLTAGHLFADTSAQRTLNDAQSADRHVVVMNLEAGLPCSSRRTFMLDPLHGEYKFKRRRDEFLDYAMCSVATDVNHRPISQAFESVAIAGKLPKVGDELIVIHHAYFTRVKQITRTKCTYIDGQRIHLDKKLGSGASGGLIVNKDWRAVALFVDGLSSFPHGYLLGSILNDFGAVVDEVGAESGNPVPGRTVPLERIVTPRPSAAREPRASTFGGWAKHLGDLPKPVDKSFKGVGKLWARGVELTWAEQGTAFVVAKNWILTAHHVASCAESTEKLHVDFTYTWPNAPDAAYPKPIMECVLNPSEGYFTSGDGLLSCDGSRYHLDYALVYMEEKVVNSCPEPLKLTSTIPPVETEVFIVQHAVLPGLEHKGVLAEKHVTAVSRNQLKAIDGELVYHLAGRSGGASGGPVMGSDGKVFAMHTHEASSPNEASEQNKTNFHWGVQLTAISRDLKVRYPNIVENYPQLSALLDLS